MTNSVYAKLGIKHESTQTVVTLRESFAGTVGRDELKQFTETSPELFKLLYSKRAKAQVREGVKPGGRFPVQYLFDFLYPYHEAICLECGTDVPWAVDKKQYREFCSKACCDNSSDIVERRKQTGLERYGMEPNLHPSIKRKKIKTFRANYGVSNPSQSEEIKDKKRDTCMERYGVAHHTQAGMSVFHTNNPMKTEEGKAALRAACTAKYGVPFAMQHPKIKRRLAKSNELKYGGNPGSIPHGFRRKIAYDKFGKKHVVQGYEPKAIAWLDKQKTVTRITSAYKKIPKIRYKSTSGSFHNYRPDLVVLRADGSKHIIEVKGSWPLKIKFEAVVAKALAATRYSARNGYTYWIFFYRDNGDMVRIKNPKSAAPFLELLKKKALPL